MELDAAIALLREFGPVAGFPMLVALWFMFRFERRLEQIASTQSRLLVAQAVLLRTIDGVDGAEIKQLVADNTTGVHGEGENKS